jgi:hypothetical protein
VCPLCSQPFILTYTDTEWNKLNEWRRLASAALRDIHNLRHEGRFIAVTDLEEMPVRPSSHCSENAEALVFTECSSTLKPI